MLPNRFPTGRRRRAHRDRPPVAGTPLDGLDDLDAIDDLDHPDRLGSLHGDGRRSWGERGPWVRPRRELPIARPRRRRAIRWWLGVAALSALTYAWLASALGRAEQAEARWGPTQPVLVATEDVGAGEPLDGRVAVRAWPRALAPEGALDAAPGAGAVARRPLGTGTPVPADGVAGLDPRAGGADPTGPLALVPGGSRVVVVPLALPGLPAEPGDAVDVLATDRREVLARAAVVVGVRSDRIVLAVPEGAVADVAEAMGRGPVVVALRPSG